MKTRICPAVLVHGWKSGPGVWKTLISRLTEESVPYWNFDFTGMGNVHPGEISAALQQFIGEMRIRHAYEGPIDIISHSTGGFVVRYMLEVLDGSERSERVRQFIGLGSPNNGSSMAELFNDPVYGNEILHTLAGVFVPRRYDPSQDFIVQALRPGSETTAKLLAAGIRSDVRYRMIVTENRILQEEFFPPFQGKTWEFQNGTWNISYAGDGVVPHVDSYLPGAGFDILPAEPFTGTIPPGLYCHTMLPGNPEIIDRIVTYLRDPATVPYRICE